MTRKQRRYAETRGMQVRDSCAVASGCGKMPWSLENSRAPALAMAALYPKPREAEHKIAGHRALANGVYGRLLHRSPRRSNRALSSGRGAPFKSRGSRMSGRPRSRTFRAGFSDNRSSASLLFAVSRTSYPSRSQQLAYRWSVVDDHHSDRSCGHRCAQPLGA